MKKRIGMMICFGVIFVCFLYSSYFHVDITSYTIESEKIQNNLRIVMIADVHDYHCQIKDKMINEIKNIKPDLILCVGDILDENSKSYQDIYSFLSELARISQVYMSLGNHEISFLKNHNEFIDVFEEKGIHVLEEEYEDIVVLGNSIRIGGMYDYAYGMTEGKITQKDMHNNSAYRFLKDMTNTSAFQLMMAHRPDSFVFCDAYQWNLDLVLSGHNHGGQIILPLFGGIYAPEEKWFPVYDYGYYQLGKMKMIITRGISQSGYLPRFNNSAEIVQINIT